MCIKVGNMRINTPRRKLRKYHKGQPSDKCKDANAAIKDLENAFDTETAIGDATVTVDEFAYTSSETGHCNIQLPTDQDLKQNKFQESNFSF